MPEYFLKSFFRKLFPVGGPEIQDGRDGGEGRLFGGPGETVPGTYVLAGVTAEQPIVKPAFHLIGDQRLFQLDGKIRNALAAVHHLVGGDGFCRTGVDTFPAGAAIISCIVAIKKNEPDCRFSRLPFFPIQPSPLRTAQLLSSTGALSTNPLPSTSPIPSLILPRRSFNRPRITSW